ncbi:MULTISPECIES: ORF6N domain-containing protein [unclassified Lentimicrobium]|uniref:ORF6N domain-containing protein n=1 Tax=unclassified Lentimicrobium TaxID=2677434 RepID=UPI0020A62B41|nr:MULTISPECIES: ORF6N domain-containing protein [unclassified Lentimicrobium]
MDKDKTVMNQEALIASKIIKIREERVLLDVHLAEFYGIETRALKQAVRRNRERFPDDFMYELTETDIEDVVSQNVIPSKRHFGGAVPFAFTENGVAMLSSVLNSKMAIDINIAIMRTFTMLRKAWLQNQEILKEILEIKKKLKNHDKNIELVFNYLDELLEGKEKQEPRRKIGYKLPEKGK